jgi:hypothetical protein
MKEKMRDSIEFSRLDVGNILEWFGRNEGFKKYLGKPTKITIEEG